MARAPVLRLADLPPELRKRARELRQREREAEREQFRLYCARNGLGMPVAEHEFHPVRKWAFDFAWLAEKVALEIEGGIYGMGKPCPTCGQRIRKGHGSIRMIKRDLEKYSEAAALGWRIIRVTPDDLYRPKTVDLLRCALSHTSRSCGGAFGQ